MIGGEEQSEVPGESEMKAGLSGTEREGGACATGLNLLLTSTRDYNIFQCGASYKL